MADYSDLVPGNLKPGLTTPDGQNLKPSLVTPAYSGGTPTSADEIKPSLRRADGTLKPGLVDAAGNLKQSLTGVGGSAPIAPTNLDQPFITGTTTVNQTLTCDPGAWDGTEPIAFAYQWRRNGSNISGATASTYTAPEADINAAITCRVTGTNVAGSATADSEAVTIRLVGDRYVSPTGSDSADGLTRETAWASFTKLSQWASALTQDGVGVILAGSYGLASGNTNYQNGNGVNIRIDFEPGVLVDTTAAVAAVSPIAVSFASPNPAVWIFNLRGARCNGNNVLSANGIGGFGSGAGATIKLTVNGGGAVFDGYDDGVSMHGNVGQTNVTDVVINDCTFQNCFKGCFTHVNSARATHNRCTFIARSGATLGIGADQSTVRSEFYDCTFTPATTSQVGIPFHARRCVIGTPTLRVSLGNASATVLDWADSFLNVVGNGPGNWIWDNCYGYVEVWIRGSTSVASSITNCVFEGFTNTTKFAWPQSFTDNGTWLGGSPVFRNCVFYDFGTVFESTNANQRTHINTNWLVENCCFFENTINIGTGLTIGTSSLLADPILNSSRSASTNQADWAIASNSPCIGAGVGGANIGFSLADLA